MHFFCTNRAAFGQALNSGAPPDFLHRGCMCKRKCPSESLWNFLIRRSQFEITADLPQNSLRASGGDFSNTQRAQKCVCVCVCGGGGGYEHMHEEYSAEDVKTDFTAVEDKALFNVRMQALHLGDTLSASTNFT